MKKLLLLTIVIIFFSSCSEDSEEIDNTTVQLIGSRWSTFDGTFNNKDVYEILYFHQDSVEIYTGYVDGTDISTMFKNSQFKYSFSRDQLTIKKYGQVYSGTKEGDVIKIFDNNYTIL